MPRPNPARDAQDEDNLAQRIAHEREQRGWTYEGLAARMKQAGCPIHPSALYKIEKGTPRRRITVNEFRAFSQVLAIPMDELVADPLVVQTGLVMQYWTDLMSAREEVVAALQHLRACEMRVGEAIDKVPKAKPALLEKLRSLYRPDADADKADYEFATLILEVLVASDRAPLDARGILSRARHPVYAKRVTPPKREVASDKEISYDE